MELKIGDKIYSNTTIAYGTVKAITDVGSVYVDCGNFTTWLTPEDINDWGKYPELDKMEFDTKLPQEIKSKLSFTEFTFDEYTNRVTALAFINDSNLDVVSISDNYLGDGKWKLVLWHRDRV